MISEYRKLRTQIDSEVANLEKTHTEHLKCKSGCDLCCMDYRIFPVEYYSILNELKENNPILNELKTDLPKDTCVFLQNHKCSIYGARPIICRTHGLPLLFANDNGEWELSACELNFTQFNFEEFTFDNTFPQDKFNSKLFLLNKKFIKTLSEKSFNEFDLLPLKDLLIEL